MPAVDDWDSPDSVDTFGLLRMSRRQHGGDELGAGVTHYDYDAFGRPTRITPPDGSAHDALLSYAGDRTVTRTVKIGSSRNTSGLIVEEPVATTETYDRQGRLISVAERSSPTGGTTTTSYAYDVGGRLKSVVTNSQTRLFSYDHRGFLLSETHPEKGATGNGTVTYGSYDGREYLVSANCEAPARSAATREETPAGVPGVLIFADGFETGNTCGWSQTVGGVGLPSCNAPPLSNIIATYTSDGRLMHLVRSGLPEQTFYFHFYGRPIAQLEYRTLETLY